MQALWPYALPHDTPWTGSWRGIMRCERCRSLRDPSIDCPVCAHPAYEKNAIVQGWMPWSVYVLLRLMQRDWENQGRLEEYANAPSADRIPEHLSIVIHFCTMFETLLEDLLTEGARDLPARVRDDLFSRYQNVGRRMDRLYRLLFGTLLQSDFEKVSYSNLFQQLRLLQDRRNAFVHGDPEVIDHDLVELTIEILPPFQTAWIALNNRCFAARFAAGK